MKLVQISNCKNTIFCEESVQTQRCYFFANMRENSWKKSLWLPIESNKILRVSVRVWTVRNFGNFYFDWLVTLVLQYSTSITSPRISKINAMNDSTPVCGSSLFTYVCVCGSELTCVLITELKATLGKLTYRGRARLHWPLKVIDFERNKIFLGNQTSGLVFCHQILTCFLV